MFGGLVVGTFQKPSLVQQGMISVPDRSTYNNFGVFTVETLFCFTQCQKNLNGNRVKSDKNPDKLVEILTLDKRHLTSSNWQAGCCDAVSYKNR
ncbi:hypothetical protein MiSe_06850 [Microseira wollei NIES-4236]|uniref:Uncharacterized protein n=1 Tax=Microseira wollei NIES-4236 TaxID=2530354 RepID=A0AAV3X9B5_9CYAN|nr:hypothetical protein MiSe_06850 [Microseira wollei NIES-4236]